jgi:FtsZ-binding cell division protein ZapB
VTFIRKRCFKIFDKEAFKRDLILHGGLESIGRAQDVDQQVELLEEMINSVLDVQVPFRMFKQRDCFKSGLSQETKDLMKSRDSLQKEMRFLKGQQQNCQTHTVQKSEK